MKQANHVLKKNNKVVLCCLSETNCTKCFTKSKFQYDYVEVVLLTCFDDDYRGFLSTRPYVSLNIPFLHESNDSNRGNSRKPTHYVSCLANLIRKFLLELCTVLATYIYIGESYTLSFKVLNEQVHQWFLAVN